MLGEMRILMKEWGQGDELVYMDLGDYGLRGFIGRDSAPVVS